MHDSVVSPMPASEEQSAQSLAKEIFLDAAGARTVRLAAEALSARGIVPMPLKGVLLQRWVYSNGPFRPIRDVDLLVPEDRFIDAVAALEAAGFSEAHWERGRWQVTIFKPGGPRLGVDLHRRLTRTHRARLTSAGMFQRATMDTRLFSAPIMLPCPDDLFAHLLLHATLHWLNLGKLHRPDDFEAVASALELDPHRCATHLAQQGMLAHASLMLPLIKEHTRGTFVERLANRLPPAARAGAGAWVARTLASRFRVGHPARRFAGLALAPSLSAALLSATRDRMEASARD
jgi:hypothetical protein